LEALLDEDYLCWYDIPVGRKNRHPDFIVLHTARGLLMGWTNSHLHEFVCGRDYYGIPDEDFPSDLHDEVDYPLNQMMKKEKDKLAYI
jgi:hypothetical protein